MAFTLTYSDPATKTFLTRVTNNNPAITVLTLPATVRRIGDCAFANVQSIITRVNCGKASSLTYIGDNCFSECEALTKIANVSNSVTHIGTGAFSYSKLYDFKWPTSTNIIKGYTFVCCYWLGSIIIPQNVTLIESLAFSACQNLINIQIQKKTDPLTFLETCSFIMTGANQDYPNYIYLIEMLKQGYTADYLITAGFTDVAVAAAVNNNK
jgi:hypothetical protein